MNEVLSEIETGNMPEAFDMADETLMGMNDTEDVETEGTDVQEDEDEDGMFDEELPSSDEESQGVHKGWIKLLDDDLIKKVLEPGIEGTIPEPKYICQVSLNGCLKDGKEFQYHDLLTLQLGDAEEVLGVDLVLLSMRVGEKSLVQVGPKLGYGNIGRVPDIPPNEILIYLIQLLSAEPEPDLKTYTPGKLLEIGVRKRERGNWWHSRELHDLALVCYERALDYLQPSHVPPGGEADAVLLQDRLKVFNNMGSVHLKAKRYDMALDCIDRVLAYWPDNVKALFRRGKILEAFGDQGAALDAFSKVVALDPENSAAQTAVRTIQSALKASSTSASANKLGLGRGDGGVATKPSTSSGPDTKPSPSADAAPKNEKKHSPSNNARGCRMRWDFVFLGTIAGALLGAAVYRGCGNGYPWITERFQA